MILTSGAFDGLHSGHVAYLEAAKALCDPGEQLWCAVAPDRYITREKQRTPRWSADHRCAAVTGLRCVDRAYVSDDISVAGDILTSSPRMLVKGIDWKDRLPDDVLKACQACGTVVWFVNTPGTHVSETLA